MNLTRPMRRAAVVALGLALVSCGSKAATPPGDGPFGIDMGEQLDRLDHESQQVDWMFKLVSPPIAHSLFREYFVTATSETGVCKVEAHTLPSHLTVDEDEKEVLAQLTPKYGEGSKRPFTRRDPAAFEWGGGSAAAEKEHVEKIIVSQRRAYASPYSAFHVGDEYVVIQYFFTNFKACDDIINKPLNDVREKIRKGKEEGVTFNAGKL